MINFPILDRLDISGYGLFPGAEPSHPGLQIEFRPGITLILGTNGLGKSTLVSIIYRLLAGPFDIPGLLSRADLGTTKTDPKALSPVARGTFGARVVDGADKAMARLAFQLGPHKVVVERRLSDLSLTHFDVDGKTPDKDEKGGFQNSIVSLVGLRSFGDWILLLRHLTFYFEDRRALVWDPAAQRQILRFLFLPASTADRWIRREREILELDTRMRNLSAALFREEQALSENEVKSTAGRGTRKELEALEKLQANDKERLTQLDDQFVEFDAAREQARLRVMKAEQEREARFRELERAKLTAISSRFPNRSETARYILAQLLIENTCLVCENVVPKVAATYSARIDAGHCVVCNSDLSRTDNMVSAAALADKRASRLKTGLSASENDLIEARLALDVAERRYQSHLELDQELRAGIASRARRMDHLVRELPPTETDIHEQRGELATMRSRVEQMKGDLQTKRKRYRALISEVSRELVTRSEEIKTSFNGFAEGFLLEDCKLVWSSKKGRLGQTGEVFDFPAFELDMAGSDFPSPVRRTGPEQVSESQREFIDLAFRMALMAVAGQHTGGTLVIDAPEASLDAVFEKRAAGVLARFAEPARQNRLIITSNLVEGSLIPRLVEAANKQPLGGVVNLLSIATPTAAVRELRSEYEAVLSSIMKHGRRRS
jgi:energy-coupling factor transporter ATP-binding protein EcfA2